MTDMTPEEINQRVAEWAGWKKEHRGWRSPEGVFYFDEPSFESLALIPQYPDYYHTNAAMDLLGVLVERGCTYKMLGAPDTHYMEIGDSTGYCPMAATKCQKTPSAAICTAILELIEREGR